MAKREEPPTMVSAIVHRSRDAQREVLIGKLPGPPYAGKWSFPAGQAEGGDAPEAALRRVLQSMLDMTVQINFGQPPFDHAWEHCVRRWRYYFCEVIEGPTNNRYFEEIRWVPRGALREYEFDPVSQQVVDWILAEDQ